MLFMTADTGTPVDPIHAKKTTALLQGIMEDRIRFCCPSSRRRDTALEAHFQGGAGVDGHLFVPVLAVGNNAMNAPNNGHRAQPGETMEP